MKWQLIVGKMSCETFKTNGFRGVPWVSQLVKNGGPQCSAKALLDQEHLLEVDPWFPQLLDYGSVDGCEILQHLVTPLGL